MASKAGWINDNDLTNIDKCILRNNNTEIAIEFNSEGYTYQVSLNQSASGKYLGTFTRSGDQHQGNATAQLFNTEDGYLLFGYWREDNIPFKWFLDVEKEED